MQYSLFFLRLSFSFEISFILLWWWCDEYEYEYECVNCERAKIYRVYQIQQKKKRPRTNLMWTLLLSFVVSSPVPSNHHIPYLLLSYYSIFVLLLYGHLYIYTSHPPSILLITLWHTPNHLAVRFVVTQTRVICVTYNKYIRESV